MGSNSDGNGTNIAASWPHIVNERLLNEASILPHLLHEASEEAQQQRQQQQQETAAIAIGKKNGEVDLGNEEQLQNMIENYSKHVTRQKQQHQPAALSATGRSASHLQRKINAPQPTPMSHSHPCLFSDGGTKVGEGQAAKRASMIASEQPPPYPNLHAQQHSDPRDVHPQQADCNGGVVVQYRQVNGQQQQQQRVAMPTMEQHNLLLSENVQFKQQNEKLQKRCELLERLEVSYRKIEGDYEQMLSKMERREELNRTALQKLDQQLRLVSTENEQLRAKLGSIFGQQMREGGEQQIHFLLNELIPKNNELLLLQERQRLEIEAQCATLEEQRTHIDVLEKALTNTQERLAAKERSAVDAVAVVDKCAHLQRMLQEALEDKQRQKEQHGRQTAQLEMELTQLRLQLAKENNSQAALGSLGRKGGAMAAPGGGTSPEAADELLKLRRTLAQKEERICQLEQGLLQMQGRRCFGEERELATGQLLGTPGARLGVGRGTAAELDTRAMRLELEKAEKERRIQELLDEKMRIQMQWTEERRTLDMRVRMLEKDLRHFMGSQSSLASSGFGAIYPPDLVGQSPFASIRGEKSPYLRHRSTVELPTSAGGAVLYEEERAGGMDVMARMEELGRKLAERRAKGSERTTTVQRPSDLGLVHVSAEEAAALAQGQSRSSSSEQPPLAPLQQDLSPCSEDNAPNGAAMLHRQSAPSSAGSSSKKRYLVNAPASQLNAYLEQLPEATRRRLTGDRIAAGGFHLVAGIERNGAGAGAGRREGGCRRLIKDHSVDVGRKGSGQQQAEGLTQLALAPPPNYQEAAQQRWDGPVAPPPPAPPPPPYQPNPGQQLRQMHQMASIEEPMQEPPGPSPSTAFQQQAGKAVNVLELRGEEGDSDTLTGHKQLVFRRSSLGNANLIAK